MRITELARRTGVTVKAVRYYEWIGLLAHERSVNGYREFDESHVRVVGEIRELSENGIAPSRAGPFIECLDLGHEHSDECVSSLCCQPRHDRGIGSHDSFPDSPTRDSPEEAGWKFLQDIREGVRRD